MFYRLVIQNNPDGSLEGASAYDTPTSEARPITAQDLKSYMPEVNAAALSQKAALEAEKATLVAEKTTLATKLAEYEAIDGSKLKKVKLDAAKDRKAKAEAEIAELTKPAQIKV